jgi:mono/diheme cytochrome c family protein
MKETYHLVSSFLGHRVLPKGRMRTSGKGLSRLLLILPLGRIPAKRGGRSLTGGLCLLTLLLTGCGNQMYRQPNYTPLDAPRAAPPQDSVPVNFALTPTDGRPVASTAFGARVQLPGETEAKPTAAHFTSFPAKEPTLPPPNLSDNARYEPAPIAVDTLQSPLPDDPRVVRAGQILFYNRCVQCHNPGGYGYGTVGQYLVPHPPDLAAPLVQHISDGAMFWHITMGQGKMPGFRHWATPSERWALTAYVRSLKDSKDTSDRDNAGAWTVTRNAPYPPYGVTGFQDGRSAYPFKVLTAPTGDPDSRETVHNQGFGQPPPTQTR